MGEHESSEAEKSIHSFHVLGVNTGLKSRLSLSIRPHTQDYICQKKINQQLRKVTKSKSIFPSDEALLKMLYLATQDVLRKWTGRVQNWGLILLQFSVFFPEKVKPHLR